MNKGIILFFFASLAVSCQRSDTTDEAEHSHQEPSTLSYTMYSDKTELFVEFKPLVVGQVSQFAAHFTRLGETFTALDEGSITVSLVVGDKGIRQTSDKPGSPGIFRLALKPTIAGQGTLVFDIKSRDYTDRITIRPVTVFMNRESAEASIPRNEGPGAVTFLKEQAWKIEFANEEVKPQIFHEIIKTTGEITARPFEEQVVSARSTGVVNWVEGVVTGAQVRKGERLFLLSSGNLAQGNIEAEYRQARANYEKEKADYERVQPLLKDKIVSEKDYLEIRNRYEQSRIAFETLSRNYSNGGQSVTAPTGGFIKQVLVRSGEFVETGQPLAVITTDQSLQLKADVPIRYADELPLIREAQFKSVHSDSLYSTASLSGRVMSYGKAIGGGNPFLPIYFSISNDGTLIPGEIVEVYLYSKPIANALVVPVSALIEEQGNFYVYVQTAGESFQKRRVITGINDGSNIQVRSGLQPDERVVTKGAQLIKLATQSGPVPAHGHEH